MSMIDFHSHILPGIDDGSRDAAMTRAMLEMSAAQGVTHMVATPHFYADLDTVDRFLARRERAIETAVPLAQEAGVDLFVGAEAAFFDGMSAAEEIEKLKIEGTDLLLLEMPFRAWSARDVRELERLLNGGYELILAHMERFPEFQRDKGILEAVLDLPLLVQINAEALLSWGPRHQVLKWFKAGKAHLLGSDCHNTDRRPPDLAEGRAVLLKKLGEDFLAGMDDFAEEILGL
ncbi:MAG: capsular polysaccharide biosynthesis protein [Lachnospiraceae bacterium]|nr:capsular polysaccharide biosynthesis protein [Lachnospiraceae bacterium]